MLFTLKGPFPFYLRFFLERNRVEPHLFELGPSALIFSVIYFSYFSLGYFELRAISKRFLILLAQNQPSLFRPPVKELKDKHLTISEHRWNNSTF